jgi:hypothetical protein
MPKSFCCFLFSKRKFFVVLRNFGWGKNWFGKSNEFIWNKPKKSKNRMSAPYNVEVDEETEQYSKTYGDALNLSLRDHLTK